MWLLAGLLSLLAGVALGLLGGGGSILTVPIFLYVLGLEPRDAIGTSLAVVGLTSLFSIVIRAKSGAVRWKGGLLFGFSGAAGAWIGGSLGALVPSPALLAAFGSMVIATAVAMLRPKRGAEPASGEVRFLRMASAGTAVGLLTGLVGAGGGFLIVPALVLFGGFSMQAAIATSLLVITMNSLAGLVSVSHSGAQVNFALAGGMSLLSVAGSLLGSRLGRDMNPARLRRAFALFVLALGAFILTIEGSASLSLSPGHGALTGIAVGVTLAGATHVWTRRPERYEPRLGGDLPTAQSDAPSPDRNELGLGDDLHVAQPDASIKTGRCM